MYKGTSHRLSKFSLSTSSAASDLISQNSKPSVLQSKVSSLTVPFASKFFITLPNPHIEPIQEFGNLHEN